MNHDLELAYLGLELPDPACVDELFGSVIGLTRGTDTPDGAAVWRNDRCVHRVIVEQGPRNDATFVGFATPDPSRLRALTDRLTSAGYEVSDGTSGALASRRVTALARTVAPWGTAVELVSGLEDGDPIDSDLVPGGFLTDGVGFGHVVFATTAFDESHRFVTEGLGMTQSDWLETEIMEGIVLEVHFYHCNERHHSLALARAPFELPQVLHHYMVEAREVDDVGRAFDRALAAGLPLANSLGRHDNDGMFSFYATSPAGFHVELGHGARLITDGWDDDRRYDRISRWGHEPRPAA